MLRSVRKGRRRRSVRHNRLWRCPDTGAPSFQVDSPGTPGPSGPAPRGLPEFAGLETFKWRAQVGQGGQDVLQAWSLGNLLGIGDQRRKLGVRTKAFSSIEKFCDELLPRKGVQRA